MSFYNTTNETQPELSIKWEQTAAQDHVIRKIFDCNPGGLTPFEAWKIMCSMGYNPPQTSVRRSITDLTNEGVLVMTADKRMGGYGAKNYVWKKK